MNSFEYIEVCVRLSPFTEPMAEILTAELSELPFESFVTQAPFLKCYIPKEQYRPADVKVVLSGYEAAVSFTATLVQGQNWNKAWEQEFRPIVVDGKVTVKAPFNENVPRTRFNIWIDPQMAFGTGSHHTTYMMMQRLGQLPLEQGGHPRGNRLRRRLPAADGHLRRMGSSPFTRTNLHPAATGAQPTLVSLPVQV